MELRHLRYFAVVADELNLTRAAHRLHMAQPPLTRQIKQLEEEIGVTLFERSRRGLALTTAGQFFYEHTLQVLEKLDTTITATRRIARSNLLMFGIGFVPSLFYGQLPLLVRGLSVHEQLESSWVVMMRTRSGWNMYRIFRTFMSETGLLLQARTESIQAVLILEP